MFMEINICGYRRSRYMGYVCGYLFLRCKDGREFSQNKFLANINEFTVCYVLVIKSLVFGSVFEGAGDEHGSFCYKHGANVYSVRNIKPQSCIYM